MPTLLQINSVANSGSTGRITEEIGKIVITNGWKSYIAYGRIGLASQSQLIQVGTKRNIYQHVLASRVFDRNGLGSKQATKAFIKQVKEINPDIIHLHNIHGYYINIEILFNYLATLDIPIFWTLHDCWPFTGHCAYFDFVNCDKWKVQCSLCPVKKEYPKRWFLDRSKKNFDLKKRLFNSVKKINLIPVSNWLNSLLEESFLSTHKSMVIHNGVDINVFRPLDYSELVKELNVENKMVLLGVGSKWEPRKGITQFIELSKLLPTYCQIILVGVPKQMRSTLPPSIITISRTENVSQLAKLYSLADLFINPTYEDNFPTTNLEALACGTPVLTYNTGGSIESVSPETGFIVEQGDLTGVINAINVIKEKGKAHYANACRERAVKLYNKDDRYNEYLELYNQLLKNKGTNI